ENISAWASHWALGYTVPKARFAPRFFAEYNYASGDKNPTDNSKGTFDQLYPSGHDKYGLTDQFGWENISYIRTGPEFKFTKRWTGTVRYNSYWLADVHDGIYNSLGAVLVARRPTGNAGKFVGQGFDLITGYKVNTRLTLGGGYGKLFAGTFLKNTTPGSSYNYPYFMSIYSF
ncbi:MAG TPA: alginate export family protein, partial [Terriglobales bacterium]|nr:alginate export family protein [Terriglobales bacterium]